MSINLRTLGALLLAGALASCGGGSSGGVTPSTNPQPKTTATPQATPTPSPTPAPTLPPPSVSQWSSGAPYAPAAVTISLPTAPATGDVLVAALWNNGQTDGSAETYTAPSGWTLVDQDTSQVYATYQLFTHVVGAGETNSYDFTPGSGDRANVWIAADITNASASIDAFGNAFTSSGTAFTIPAVTPSHAGDLAIAFNLPITSDSLTWTNDPAWSIGSSSGIWNGEAVTQMLSSASPVSQTATLSAPAPGFSTIVLVPPAGT